MPEVGEAAAWTEHVCRRPYANPHSPHSGEPHSAHLSPAASHPLGYLKSLLGTDEPWGLRPAYEKYKERAHAKPPGTGDGERDDAARAAGISTLEDEEDFGDAPVVGKEAATIEDIEA